jgi:hypothetical protein
MRAAKIQRARNLIMKLGQDSWSEVEMGQTAEGAVSGRVGLLALLAVVVVCGGCAAASALPLGSMLGSPNSVTLNVYHNTETRLEQNNFVVTRTNVVGKTSGFSLLGFITIFPADYAKAMRRLYANADITPGRPQTVVNMNLYQNSSYFILFGIPHTYVSGDVIEFVPIGSTNNPVNPPHLPPGATKAAGE